MAAVQPEPWLLALINNNNNNIILYHLLSGYPNSLNIPYSPVVSNLLWCDPTEKFVQCIQERMVVFEILYLENGEDIQETEITKLLRKSDRYLVPNFGKFPLVHL
jgi:hypothetical protein